MKVFIWITAVLLFIIGSAYALLCYVGREQKTTFSYKGCKVSFKHPGSLDTLSMEFGSAQRELAGCICESYLKTGDKGSSKMIMKLYKEYGYSIQNDSSKYDAYRSLDSIVKYRKSVFDPIILLD